jgi:hypothetical protein
MPVSAPAPTAWQPAHWLKTRWPAVTLPAGSASAASAAPAPITTIIPKAAIVLVFTFYSPSYLSQGDLPLGILG